MIQPILDPSFRPISLFNRDYRAAVAQTDDKVPVCVCLERENGLLAVYSTFVFSDAHGKDKENYQYIERLVKTMLWVYGGWKISVFGSEKIGKQIALDYSPNGTHHFDYDFLTKVYERQLVVEFSADFFEPEPVENPVAIGRNMNGNRIGIDLGGSDYKYAAVMDGEVVFADETPWLPKVTADAEYHLKHIQRAFEIAASHLPSVDAIGVSSAGIYIDNKVMVASLFRQIPDDDFVAKIKNLFLDIQKKYGNVPMEVRNDGDVAALAGAMSLNETQILGLAMGTSEAAGYVDASGSITGALNELAFVPVDLQEDAPQHDWSLDRGVGANYFSQEGVIRLAPAAGIELDEALSPAEKLKVVQKHMLAGHEGAAKIYESIGVQFGYAVAHYADFYDMKHILLMGRTTSGEGGTILLDSARKTLASEFPELAAKITIQLPDEKSRRVGQSIAAASLPKL